MNIWAILPLRSLHDGKQRLRSVLDQAQRRALVQRLFTHTHKTLAASGAVEGICVVSPDRALLAWVQPYGVLPLLQPVPGLNEGLEHARAVMLARYKPDALLVVLPDLPLLEPDDIVTLGASSTLGSVVLAPDRHGQGTNALLVQPASALPFAFGTGSLQRHLAAARVEHLRIQQYHAPGTAFDVDTPADLDQLGSKLQDVDRVPESFITHTQGEDQWQPTLCWRS